MLEFSWGWISFYVYFGTTCIDPREPSEALSLLCVEDDGKQESRDALFTVLLSSPTTLHWGAPSVPTPKHMTDLFLYQELGVLVCPFCLEKLRLWCYCQAGSCFRLRKNCLVGWELFFFFFKYWMKLNRSKYMPRRKNRGEVLTVEVPRKDDSQEKVASFFFFSGKMPLS